VSDTVRLERDGAVARVTLSRPEVHNAFDTELIRGLTTTFNTLATEPAAALRAVVLAGDGKTFSAGADVEWMRASLALSIDENAADATRMQAMFAAIDTCPAPVVARVHGAALGGGMGLCAVADIVLASADATFGFTEAKLGLLPAVISPFVLAKIGESHARALFPTGERFGAQRAREIGLVHEVLADEAALDVRLEALIGELLSAGPTALRAAKALIRDLRALTPAEARAHTAQHIAEQRTSAEGQEGLSAFLEKRPPSWRS
jgi:methylglutaconyl-CoA hydratase